MRNYKVYFELFGKKLVTKVTAESVSDAQKQIKDKIVFHKTEIAKDDYFNKSCDILEAISEALK